MIREIDVAIIRDKIAELAVEANLRLPAGASEQLLSLADSDVEQNPLCRGILRDMYDNTEAAVRLNVPICQDTGMAVVFIDVGQDVHFVGGDITQAINAGVAAGYERGYMRMSVVADPLERINTNTNTPAIIHTRIVAGDRVKILFAPKGFGSENMSRVKMFTPSATDDDILDFITETISVAGGNPCPPVTVGVGIGGDFELCAVLAKRALAREFGSANPKPRYAAIEREALARINALGIGACGFCGSVSGLYVNVEEYATHIAGLPVAVNVGCYVNRHAECTV
ncbi:fumarate hydratase [Clostridia bacterium]|nr:fumarate hydratase [Clostridia bacterium]